jgi:peptidoglycan/xylan/chitin deacetylase (PgdA/CDA1 family)
VRRITLTFDNGPEPDVTPDVLDVLAKVGVSSTFFVLGSKLTDPAGYAICERAHGEGHWIGNHTFSHSAPLGSSTDPDRSPAEIGRTQTLIGDLSHERRFFRPFGGGGRLGKHLLDRPALNFLTEGGYTCVLWNVIPEDWKDPSGWAARALAQSRDLDWTLVVLHDLPTGAMNHLEHFIEQAREDGASFVQDFPPDCVPILRGRLTMPIDPYVTGPAA